MQQIELMASGLLVGCIWAVICRLRAMNPSRATIAPALQHFALGIGLVGGFMVPQHAAILPVAAGLAAYMAIGAVRWRNGAPNELRAPTTTNGDPT